MYGIISSECGNIDVLLERLRAKKQEPRNLVMEVTTREPIHVKGPGKRVVLLDLGVKYSIIRYRNEKLRYIYTSRFIDLRDNLLQPDGILVSNGPGDPKDLPSKALASEIDRQIPILGICLGHQLLGLALGATPTS